MAVHILMEKVYERHDLGPMTGGDLARHFVQTFLSGMRRLDE